MSLYETSRDINKRLFALTTNIAFDEQEVQDIINTIIVTAYTSRMSCKNNNKFKKFIKLITEDICTTKKTKIKIGEKEIEVLQVQEVLIEDD